MSNRVGGCAGDPARDGTDDHPGLLSSGGVRSLKRDAGRAFLARVARAVARFRVVDL